MDREALRTLVFRHREALLVAMSVPVAVSALRGGGIDRTGTVIGVGIAAAAVALRLCAVRQIGRGARVFHAHARGGMVASGPYRWCRNPLYLAAAGILCGLGWIAGAGPAAFLFVPATLLAYTPVVWVEERALRALFGDGYQRYLDQVPRWIGFGRGYRGETGSERLAWGEVFRRESRLVPGTLAAILAIAAVRSEQVPLPAIARRVELALGCDLAVIVSAAIGIAIAVNAVKVERHQQRRRTARASARL